MIEGRIGTRNKMNTKVVDWLQSNEGQEHLNRAAQLVLESNMKLQKAREIDRKDLLQPVTL